MVKENILIIDDEKEISDLIKIYMENEGFRTTISEDGNRIEQILETEKPDLVILDVLLPGSDGIELCHKIRKKSDVPIIFLSCKNEDMDKILGLRVGGDDYMTKPFNPKELVARVHAQIRRNRIRTESSQPAHLLKFDALCIDLERHEVRIDDKNIFLSNKEFEILVILAQNPNRVFTYDQIINLAWNTEPLEHDTRTIMVHISNLRKKIETDPQNPVYVLTVRGVGYKFGLKNSL